MEKYEVVKQLGAGNFGVARLMRHKETKELVAMKYIERGHKVVSFYFKLVYQKYYYCYYEFARFPFANAGSGLRF